MHIANPIYDVVFKYMMEDGKIAKLIIASIIGEEITELKFQPKEFTTELDKKTGKHKIRHSKTVYRLDFSAVIKTSEGLKHVIIEIQKAKFATDIMRFRKYLGEQYANKENTQIVTQQNRKRKIGIPIVSIYFLGHKLHNTKASVIGIKRTYTDLITGKALTTREAFIESLTHDSFVIQIPELAHKRRNELEILLSVFDQSNAVDNEQHILNVKEEDFPERYRTIIRKLQTAVQDAEIKKKMILEDGILDELEEMDREIEELTDKVERTAQEKEKVEQEKEKVEQEKEKIEQEKEKIEQEKEKIEQEKEKVEQEKERVEQENIALKKRLEELEKGKK